jgi:shikimate dehydrogenase
MIKATTKIVAIIGSPIVQVKMPEMLNAAFAERDLAVVMIPLDMGRDGIDAFVTVLRNWKNLLGCVVTVPYKQSFKPHMDEVSERSRRLQAVNVIRRNPDGALIGDMLDGRGFVSALLHNGFDIRGCRAAVIGAGGAGSAIADALCEAGAQTLAITDTDIARLDRVTAMLAATGGQARISRHIGALENYDLVVNATPSGMNGDPSLPLPEDAIRDLRPETFVADVVTVPAITPFLVAAKTRGCRIQTGADMARAQVELIGSFVGAL